MPRRLSWFLRYPELVAALEELAHDHPDLVELSTIGASREGRDIPLATITRKAAGAAIHKPAMWIDANIHATEVAGSAVALGFLRYLANRCATDGRIGHLLDTRTVYVVPRVNPDGAELTLADNPRRIRSSTRCYPFPEQQPGIVEHDVDGDGRILMMRFADPGGAWVRSEDDPRLMVPRRPEDVPLHTQTYRLLPEGSIAGYDGSSIRMAVRQQALDLNRNFPATRPLVPTAIDAAGPFPLSEPESRSVVQAIIDRPNVCAAISYHTSGGVYLHPFGDRPPERLAGGDQYLFTSIGRLATQSTGHPSGSAYALAPPSLHTRPTGVFDDWCYERRGILSWTAEIWDPRPHLGLPDASAVDWYDNHPVEHDLALVRWSDSDLGGQGFVEWYEFNHPQLGLVELGGWDRLHCLSNPPPHVLGDECARHFDFAVTLALLSPRLVARSCSSTLLAESANVWEIQVEFDNVGQLPTNVTSQALAQRLVLPVTATLTHGSPVTLLSPNPLDHGQLAGRPLSASMLGFLGDGCWDTTEGRMQARWVVRGDRGERFQITASHERAGRVTVASRLGDTRWPDGSGGTIEV